MIQQIPLNKLSISPRNARRTDRLDGIQQLKADIEARGVLQNLIGFKVAKKRDVYEITAGGRRLTALLMLAAEGKLPADHPVNVFVLNDTGAAAEASLAENFQRLAMNPADECAAFGDFMAVENATVEDVARRFGVTVRFVHGRLRLAGLDASVFDALREGLISLDVAQAFASTSDTALQARVYAEEADGHYAMTAERIRRLLTQSLTTGASPLALLVGKPAYLAAGGRIDSDLFGDPDGEFWLDPALLRDLAEARMAEAAATLAPGFAAVRTTLSHWPSGEAFEDLRPLSLPAPVLTDDERARLDAISAAIEGIEAEAGDDGDDLTDAMIAQVETLEAEAAAIRSKPPVISDAVKETATAVIVLDRDGNLRVHQQLFVARSQREPQSPEAEASDKTGGALGGFGDASDGNPGSRAVNAATLSQALKDELAVQRRDILRLHIASDPGFAIDLAVFVLAEKMVRNGASRHGFGLSSTTDYRSASGRDLETPAKNALAALGQGLDHSWTAYSEIAARFDAFRALSDEVRAAWAGWTISYSLESTIGDENAFHNHLGGLLDVDSAAWWRPTAVNYFGRVKKDTILAAFEAVGGNELRGRYASAKKGDVAAAAEKLFGGTAIIEADVRARAIAWVPSAMTFGPAPVGETVAEPDTEVGEAERDDSAEDGADGADSGRVDAANGDGTEAGLSEAA